MDRLSEIRARCESFENSNDSYKDVRPKYILPVLADDGYSRNWAEIAAHSHEDIPYLLGRLRELAEADRDGRCVVLDSPRKPLIWGDDEHNSCLCPECGFDLIGIHYGNQMVLQCPECGQYIDAKKCVTYAEAAESALKAGEPK